MREYKAMDTEDQEVKDKVPLKDSRTLMNEGVLSEFLYGHTSVYCSVLGHVGTQICLCWYLKDHEGRHYWEDYGATALTTEDNLTQFNISGPATKEEKVIPHG